MTSWNNGCVRQTPWPRLEKRMPAHTEPILITDPSLNEIVEELKGREPIFHRLEFGTTRADFERMTAPDFWETGASGQRYSREYVLKVLEERYRESHPDAWETQDFYCRQLAESVFLLTYTLFQSERKTRRVTIWQRSAEGWKILYHQGTIVQDVDEFV